jgi:CheY-like chemotaxis protein
MGGSIFVESEVGAGTRIYISLPFGFAESVPAPVAPIPATKTSLIQGRRVLLVDDDWTSCLFTERQLEMAGAVVKIVRNGLQALEALRETSFDLMLMDVQMPVMDGVEATQRIRNGEAGKDKAGVPIFALTAYAMPGDREAFLDAGMNGYLSKPIEIDELIRRIERLLAQAGG